MHQEIHADSTENFTIGMQGTQNALAREQLSLDYDRQQGRLKVDSDTMEEPDRLRFPYCVTATSLVTCAA